jgi:hypothetical protein
MGTLREDFISAVRSAMAVEGQKLQTALADEVDTRGITNRGSLRKEFEQQLTVSGSSLVLRVTGVRYANYVAEGTDPGYWPPKPPIKRWVETKLSPPEPLVPDAVYGTRKAIHDSGTPSANSPLKGRNDYVKAALRRRLPDLLDTIERRAAEAAG